MKHIFIINPAAGKENSFASVQQALASLKTPTDYELYQTKAPKDATLYIQEYCRRHTEPVRFYACGGDGTLNEVANGVVGFPHASFSCYPCGSGNDFVKYYGGKEVFLDIPALLEAKEEYIDLMRVGDRYAINATHFGFDSCVAKTMSNVRRKKLIGGKNAYVTGVIAGLLVGMKNKCSVTVDGELLDENEKMLLCTLANGQYVGGTYRCAPRSHNNDGLLEVCFVRPVSHLTFLRLMGDYKRGTHLGNPKFDKYIFYRRGKKIEVQAPEGFVYCLDGEPIACNSFTVEAVPRAVRFAVPASAKPLIGAEHVPVYTTEPSKEELSVSGTYDD